MGDLGSGTALRPPGLGRQRTVILPTQSSTCASFPGLFTAGEIAGFQDTVFHDVLVVVAYAWSTQAQNKTFAWGQGEHVPCGKIWLGTSNTGVISYSRRHLLG